MKEISIKIENIEARVCKDYGAQDKYEIVQWHHKMDGDYCTVISFIDVDECDDENNDTYEDVSIRTIGSRLHGLINYEKECYDDVLDTLLKFIFDKRR